MVRAMAKDNSHMTSGEDPDPRTHRFGFTPVAESERQTKVNKVFAKVASRYDVLSPAMLSVLSHISASCRSR